MKDHRLTEDKRTLGSGQRQPSGLYYQTSQVPDDPVA